MELNLKGQKVLITGSSHGIGKAIAEAFLKEGARVVLTGRNPERLDRAETELATEYEADHVLAVECDLISQKGIDICRQAVIKKWNEIDHIILNVGSGRSVSDPISSEEQWQNVMDLNLNSAVRVIRTFLPDLQKQKKGSITFISSITGMEALGAPTDYSVAKSALNALAKNLSRKVAGDGIRVNTVVPGNIFFEDGTWDHKCQENREDVEKMLKEKVPMQRFGSPEEVAAAVVFLASSHASFTTGSFLTVDGGQTVSI